MQITGLLDGTHSERYFLRSCSKYGFKISNIIDQVTKETQVNRNGLQGDF